MKLTYRLSLSAQIAALGILAGVPFGAAPAAHAAEDHSPALPGLTNLLHQAEGRAVLVNAPPVLPPFVTSAQGVTAELTVDMGKLAREMGGPIALVHPKPLVDAYHRFEVTATYNGQPVEADTTSEKSGRSIYVVKGDEASGLFRIRVDGVRLNATSKPRDALETPVKLTPAEWAKYTDKSEVAAIQNEGWKAKVSELGLERKLNELPYDYSVRVGKFIQQRYNYADPDSEFTRYPEKMFDTPVLDCAAGVRMVWALTRYADIPCQIVSGWEFNMKGGMDPHSKALIFDERKGWFPMDVAMLVGSGKRAPVETIVGSMRGVSEEKEPKRFFIPITNATAFYCSIPELPAIASTALSSSPRVIRLDNSSTKWLANQYGKCEYKGAVQEMTYPQALEAISQLPAQTDATPPPAATQAFAKTDILSNGDFAAGLKDWGFLVAEGRGEATIVDAQAGPFHHAVQIKARPQPGDPAWSVKFGQVLASAVPASSDLLVTFWMRSPERASITGVVQISESPFTAKFATDVSLTPEWSQYQMKSSITEPWAAGEHMFEFHLGRSAATIEIAGVQMFVEPRK